MLQQLPAEADLLCLHPMFGPESGKDDWHGPPFNPSPNPNPNPDPNPDPNPNLNPNPYP